VLPIIEANVYETQAVIISEFVRDGSLRDVLKKERHLDAGRAAEIVVGLLSGLEHLHSNRIIHRDLKPENVLMQGRTPRLADFGISRTIRTGVSVSTIIPGTPDYMAPEAFDGLRNETTDIWSVGVILYELVTGQRPFRTIGSIYLDEPPPSELIPHDLAQVVAQSLHETPTARFQTAGEMRETLEGFLYARPRPRCPYEADKASFSVDRKKPTVRPIEEAESSHRFEPIQPAAKPRPRVNIEPEQSPRRPSPRIEVKSQQSPAAFRMGSAVGSLRRNSYAAAAYISILIVGGAIASLFLGTQVAAGIGMIMMFGGLISLVVNAVRFGETTGEKFLWVVANLVCQPIGGIAFVAVKRKGLIPLLYLIAGYIIAILQSAFHPVALR
jgi:serine/threonine protein kinase